MDAVADRSARTVPELSTPHLKPAVTEISAVPPAPVDEAALVAAEYVPGDAVPEVARAEATPLLTASSIPEAVSAAAVVAADAAANSQTDPSNAVPQPPVADMRIQARWVNRLVASDARVVAFAITAV